MDMGWRSSFRPASFRGVPFVVESRDISGGRRLAIHEYPRRDEPYPEDMGRKRRSFSVTAFQLGRGYLSPRNALHEALEQEGPGEYVDPWGQKHRVVVASYSSSERLREGGYVSWRITFEESGERPGHGGAEDTAARLEKAASLAKLTALAHAVGRWNALLPLAMEHAAACLNPLLQGSGILTQGLSGVQSILGMPGAVFSQLHHAGLLARGIASLADLISAPAVLMGLVGSLVTRSVSKSGSSSAEQIRHALRLAATPALAERRAGRMSLTDEALWPGSLSNPQTLAAVQRNIALLEASQAVSRTDFDTMDVALATRDTICAGLSTAMRDAPDDLYTALSDVRVAVTRDIRSRAADIASLDAYTPKTTMPAVLLAYKVYGTAAREDDVLRRNTVRHPGFMPGGSPVVIIKDAHDG